MNPDDYDAIAGKRICCHCVGEVYLSNEIERDGTVAVCGYCGGAGMKAWSIGDLADQVEVAFADYYVRTSGEPPSWGYSLLADRESNYSWEREGDRAVDAIQTAAKIPNEAAADVQAILENRCYDFDSTCMGEETEFASDAHYEWKSPDAAEWYREYLSFEHALKTEARFFSRRGATHLADIFNGINALKTTDNSPLVFEVGPFRQIDHLYRARVFQSEDKLKAALCSPDRHLGPPPSALASAGRMNARGISVFYGATEVGTAVAEVRPPVGSWVATASFAITRPLCLLDLTVIEKVKDEGSVFDPTLKGRLERIAFLHSLGQLMTRPVMPDDEAFDYLSTQAIADFLATENTPQVDGIIFSLAQSEEGRNVVLFHKAARTTEIKLPQGTAVEASTHSDTDEGPEIDYQVWVEVLPAAPPGKDESTRVPFRTGPTRPLDGDSREVTLCIDPESVVVHHVESVAYTCTPHQVARHHVEKRGRKF